jgi:hypothetical protein
MRKGITLLTVLLLPITIYLIFAVSTIHYVRVPHYGPRSARMIEVEGKQKKDSVYYSIKGIQLDSFSHDSGGYGMYSECMKYPHMYLALFIQPDSIKNNYNAAALKAYNKVNKGELDTLHFWFMYPCGNDSCKMNPEFADSMGISKKQCRTSCLGPHNFESNQVRFFITEPGKKDPWKSKTDMVLIDTKGCVRGYYDGRFAPEITRLIEDIKHIKFHDEAAGMEEKYTPHQKHPKS